MCSFRHSNFLGYLGYWFEIRISEMDQIGNIFMRGGVEGVDLYAAIFWLIRREIVLLWNTIHHLTFDLHILHAVLISNTICRYKMYFHMSSSYNIRKCIDYLSCSFIFIANLLQELTIE